MNKPEYSQFFHLQVLIYKCPCSTYSMQNNGLNQTEMKQTFFEFRNAVKVFLQCRIDPHLFFLCLFKAQFFHVAPVLSLTRPGCKVFAHLTCHCAKGTHATGHLLPQVMKQLSLETVPLQRMDVRHRSGAGGRSSDAVLAMPTQPADIHGTNTVKARHCRGGGAGRQTFLRGSKRRCQSRPLTHGKEL